MSDAEVVDKYPKATVSKVQVAEIQADRLKNGASSCTLSEDATNWILTTVWPGE